jgi:replicative DNA helicase
MPDPEFRPEERVLAVLLRNPSTAPEVSIRADQTWFLSPILSIAFDAAVSYSCEYGIAPTKEILLDLMGRRNPGDRKSHPDALSRVLAVPATSDEAKHITYYCELLERDWKARTAKAVMLAAADMLDKGAIDDAVESLQRDITIPLTKFTKGELASDFGAFWSDYENIAKDPSRRYGTPTGFRTIDTATNGHFNKELWVMVGGPGVGKSLFLGQVAVNAALKKKRVLLITVENSRDVYMRRLYSNIATVPYRDLKTASLVESDKNRLMEAVGSLPEDFCLEIVHMNPPCCSRDILNIMRSAKTAYDYLVVDQITNMSPNHVRDFKVMDWRWYSQIALELRVLGDIVYGGRGIPVLTAVHAAGGTTDKKELTTDDTALAKSIGYHADGMLYFTRKDNEYIIGKSKLRDAFFEPFSVFPVWENWTLREDPPQQKYGQTIDDIEAAKIAPANTDVTFDVAEFESRSKELEARDNEIASMGESIPDDFVPTPPPLEAAPAKDENTMDPNDI